MTDSATVKRSSSQNHIWRVRNRMTRRKHVPDPELAMLMPDSDRVSRSWPVERPLIRLLPATGGYSPLCLRSLLGVSCCDSPVSLLFSGMRLKLPVFTNSRRQMST